MVTSIDTDALRRKYAEERDKRLRPDGNDQYIQIADGQDAGAFLGRGYPYGPSAYFAYIDRWRASGTFDGLEFRRQAATLS